VSASGSAGSGSAGSGSAGSGSAGSGSAGSGSASGSAGSGSADDVSDEYDPLCNVEACNAYIQDNVLSNVFFETDPEDSNTACYKCPIRGYSRYAIQIGYSYQFNKNGNWESYPRSYNAQQKYEVLKLE